MTPEPKASNSTELKLQYVTFIKILFYTYVKTITKTVEIDNLKKNLLNYASINCFEFIKHIKKIKLILNIRSHLIFLFYFGSFLANLSLI